MARARKFDPARGNVLRGSAIVSAAIYTTFAVGVSSGGTNISYQVTLWSLWATVMLVAAGTFAIGAAMHRTVDAPDTTASETAPALTSVI